MRQQYQKGWRAALRRGNSLGGPRKEQHLLTCADTAWSHQSYSRRKHKMRFSRAVGREKGVPRAWGASFVHGKPCVTCWTRTWKVIRIHAMSYQEESSCDVSSALRLWGAGAVLLMLAEGSSPISLGTRRDDFTCWRDSWHQRRISGTWEDNPRQISSPRLGLRWRFLPAVPQGCSELQTSVNTTARSVPTYIMTVNTERALTWCPEALQQPAGTC